MSLTYDELAAQAMKLPPASRAQLADQLVQSLATEQDAIEKAWAKQAVCRREEVRCGKVKPSPGEQVRDEVRRMVGR